MSTVPDLKSVRSYLALKSDRKAEGGVKSVGQPEGDARKRSFRGEKKEERGAAKKRSFRGGWEGERGRMPPHPQAVGRWKEVSPLSPERLQIRPQICVVSVRAGAAKAAKERRLTPLPCPPLSSDRPPSFIRCSFASLPCHAAHSSDTDRPLPSA